MRRARLVVMLKAPRPGRVKTRLARDIGSVDACWWFRHQVRHLLRRLDDPRWQLVLAISPDAALRGRDWPAHLPRIPQGQGDLGDRMGRILRSAVGPTCIIGGDIPGIACTHIARAFAVLGGHDAVFGPTLDGGYWLVGLKGTRAVPAKLFDGVRWSTRHALDDSISSLRGARVGFADMLQDIDTGADLAAWRGMV